MIRELGVPYRVRYGAYSEVYEDYYLEADLYVRNGSIMIGRLDIYFMGDRSLDIGMTIDKKTPLRYEELQGELCGLYAREHGDQLYGRRA